jgi:hypothetical protein
MPGHHPEEQPSLISNLEVLDILQKRTKRRSHSNKYRHADWVAGQVRAYLATTPCTRIDGSKRDEMLKQLQSNKKKSLLSANPSENGGKTTATTGFGLTQAEAIQCLNLVPTEPVEIHLLVEDLSGRMSDRQQEELLDFISSYDTAQKEECPQAVVEENGESQLVKKEEEGEDDRKPAAVASI